MDRFTSQTPPTTLEFIRAKALDFPADWTLTQVAEETHRRYLAGRQYGSAGVAVTRWAMHKLAQHPEFKAEHWKWLTPTDRYGREDGVSRLMDIVRPAVGDNIAWKKPDSELGAALDEIRTAAKTILRGMKANPEVGASLPEVASLFVELKPVADAAAELQLVDTTSIREEVQRARREGREPKFGPRPLRGVRQPHLYDFLYALLAKLDGELGSYVPKLKWSEEIDADSGEGEGKGEGAPTDDEDGQDGEIDPDAAVELSRKFGISPTALGLPRPPVTLRPGGDFGAYPNRKDSVERAIILAFPRALHDDPWFASDASSAQSPAVPMAALIEEACTAWFGKSRSQKDINSLIKEERDELERRNAEVREMRANAQEVETRVLDKLKGKDGLSDGLRDFLEPG